VHLVVPGCFDDPTRPSGGNAYDRLVGAALAAAGWDVRFVPVPGRWPQWDGAALAALAHEIAALPDDEIVLVDGLIASSAAEVLIPSSSRLHLVVLVHTLLAESGLANVPPGIDVSEAAVLATAAAVVTTSAWTRERVLTRYPLATDRVRVVCPGVDPAAVASGTAGGGALLCVANFVAHKGQDLLVAALAQVPDLDWRCVCVGALDQEPDFAARVRGQAAAAGMSHRLRFAGVLDDGALDRAYADADLVLVPSRVESYGMVVIEALARGLPVLATAVGGVPEAMGRAPNQRQPGRLVASNDPASLAAALRDWLQDPRERARLRTTAKERRRTLRRWDQAARDLAAVLQPLTGSK
jgi:glycosyltransferase involved in cell wall biosynthesis